MTKDDFFDDGGPTDRDLNPLRYDEGEDEDAENDNDAEIDF